MEQKLNLNILHVKFEDFLKYPVANTTKILDFSQQKINIHDLNSIVKDINPDRKYTFMRNKKLINIYENIKKDEIVKRLGYNNLI